MFLDQNKPKVGKKWGFSSFIKKQRVDIFFLSKVNVT